MKKSSTNKKETGKLEDVFRQAFEGAREQPPGDLWTRLDHQLQAQEAIGLKKRLAWYRRVAAACLVLLLSMGAYTYFTYHNGQGRQPEMAQQNPSRTPGGFLKEGATPNQTMPNRQAPELAAADTRPNATYAQPSGEPTLPQTPVAAGRTNVISPNIATPPTMANNSESGSRRGSSFKIPVGVSGIPAGGERLAGVGKEQDAIEEMGTAAPTLALQDDETNPALAPENSASVNDPASSPPTANPVNPFPAQPSQQSLVVLPRAQPADSLERVRATMAKAGEDLLPESLKRSRWSVGGSYGTHYFAQNIALRNDFSGPGRTLSNASPAYNSFARQSTYDQAVDEFIQNTRAAQSFGATMRAGYQLDRHWRVEGGFTFSQNESETRSSYLVTGMNILNSRMTPLGNSLDLAEDYKAVANLPTSTIMLPALAGLDSRYVSVNRTDEFTTSYRYRFVGLPLQMVFQSRQTRSFVFAAAGVSPQVLIESSVLPDSPLAQAVDLSAGEGSPFRRLNVSAMASVGYGYRMSDGLSLTLGPEVQSFMVPLVKNTDASGIRQGKPYNLGLHLTARYQLRK